MKTAWVVTGEHGRFSDFSLWILRVCLSEEDAKAFAADVQEVARLIVEKCRETWNFPCDLKHPLDPEFYAASTCPIYRVTEVGVGFLDGMPLTQEQREALAKGAETR